MIGVFGDSFGFQKDGEPFESWVTLLSKDYGIINHYNPALLLDIYRNL